MAVSFSFSLSTFLSTTRITRNRKPGAGAQLFSVTPSSATQWGENKEQAKIENPRSLKSQHFWCGINSLCHFDVLVTTITISSSKATVSEAVSISVKDTLSW